jgi:sec-independent protein translocase protein TatB
MQFDDAMREAELHDVKKSFDDMKSAADSAAAGFADPAGMIRDEVRGAVEGAAAAAEQAGGGEAGSALQRIEADIRALESEPAAPEAPRAGGAA